MRVYYNEFDKKKCAMLAQLMADGHIAQGEIDDRSIRDVRPNDVIGYDRCHFFAGIGLWEYALQLAEWDEDNPVWTGSCPCQPYSTAGRQKAQADDRHLWPEWMRLIQECRPATVFGEQVANAVTHGWLDDVYQGLEAEGYAVGSAVLPASSVGAPHRRERLWFVANSASQRRGEAGNGGKRSEERLASGGIVGNAQHDGSSGGEGLRSNEEDGTVRWEEGANLPRKPERASQPEDVRSVQGGNGGKRKDPSNVADTSGTGLEGGVGEGVQRGGDRPAEPSHWDDGVWVDCPDGKQRLIEPAIPLLANGYQARVAIIHAAGDAIVPQVAATFIRACK